MKYLPACSLRGRIGTFDVLRPTMLEARLPWSRRFHMLLHHEHGVKPVVPSLASSLEKR